MITLSSSELLYPSLPQLLKLRGQYEELEEQVEVARKENKHLQGWCDTCLECLALGFSQLSGNLTSIPEVITVFCTTYQLEYMWQYQFRNQRWFRRTF